jgi:hypothetical protein
MHVRPSTSTDSIEVSSQTKEFCHGRNPEHSVAKEGTRDKLVYFVYLQNALGKLHRLLGWWQDHPAVISLAFSAGESCHPPPEDRTRHSQAPGLRRAPRPPGAGHQPWRCDQT